jgi:hypothetical protein
MVDLRIRYVSAHAPRSREENRRSVVNGAASEFESRPTFMARERDTVRCDGWVSAFRELFRIGQEAIPRELSA